MMELSEALEVIRRETGSQAEREDAKELGEAALTVGFAVFSYLERITIALEKIAQPININVENCGGISAATVNRP